MVRIELRCTTADYLVGTAENSLNSRHCDGSEDEMKAADQRIRVSM